MSLIRPSPTHPVSLLSSLSSAYRVQPLNPAGSLTPSHLQDPSSKGPASLCQCNPGPSAPPSYSQPLFSTGAEMDSALLPISCTRFSNVRALQVQLCRPHYATSRLSAFRLKFPTFFVMRNWALGFISCRSPQFPLQPQRSYRWIESCPNWKDPILPLLNPPSVWRRHSCCIRLR